MTIDAMKIFGANMLAVILFTIWTGSITLVFYFFMPKKFLRASRWDEIIGLDAAQKIIS